MLEIQNKFEQFNKIAIQYHNLFSDLNELLLKRFDFELDDIGPGDYEEFCMGLKTWDFLLNEINTSTQDNLQEGMYNERC